MQVSAETMCAGRGSAAETEGSDTADDTGSSQILLIRVRQ